MKLSVEFAVMTMYEIRRQNLMHIRRSLFKTDKALADAIGKNPTYIRRCLADLDKKGRKNIADEIVQAIHTTFQLPPGWMDTPHTKDKLTLDKDGRIRVDSAHKDLNKNKLIDFLNEIVEVRYYLWSKRPILNDFEPKEYANVIINKRKLKQSVSDEAFLVEIDTDQFGANLKKGSNLIFNPIEQPPTHGQLLLIRLGDRETIAKYHQVAGKTYLDMLDVNYPPHIEVTQDDFTTLGVCIQMSYSEAL